jgi:transcriptional regulator with XRE-family HTH domain
MFNQVSFGENLRRIRKERNLTQETAAEKIGVSGQAVSKWEKGECLPDVYNLKMLGRLYRVSIDKLLETEEDGDEKVVETIKIGDAVFEIIHKPETILSGKIVYAKDFNGSFEEAFASIPEDTRWLACGMAADYVMPVSDITLSINFWREEHSRGMGFVRETVTEKQPEGVDTIKMPASLYIRAHTNKYTAMLISKDECEIWELFSYIRNYFMPAHGFKMAENGAQELEVYDTAEHKSGYAYMPVMRA